MRRCSALRNLAAPPRLPSGRRWVVAGALLQQSDHHLRLRVDLPQPDLPTMPRVLPWPARWRRFVDSAHQRAAPAEKWARAAENPRDLARLQQRLAHAVARIQRTKRPSPMAARSIEPLRQRGSTRSQRGAKAQPGGNGGQQACRHSTARPYDTGRPEFSAQGQASRRCVGPRRGSARTSATAPLSTMWPPYMTWTWSQISAITPKSWLMKTSAAPWARRNSLGGATP